MQRAAGRVKTGRLSTHTVTGGCICGDVKFEIDYPAFWAWHDHSGAKWVNIPRALFSGRTGREPRYHLSIQEKVDWAYMGEPLAPLKGYPGVMWVRPKRKKSVELPEGL